MAAAVLIQKRGRILGNLTKAATFLENADDRITLEELEIRCEKLTSLWDEFNNIEDELLLLPDQLSKSDEFETKYFSIQAAMSKKIKNLKPAEQPKNDDLNATISNLYSQQREYFNSFSQKSMNQDEVKVPRINIPPFDGEYTQWPSFKDLFEATVHNNNSISRVHKFQLLKGFLRGSAAQLITHFLITDSSYSEAWDKLKSRYDKKRTIVNTTITTFFNQPNTHHASANSLRKLTDTSDELLRGLKALGSECETRDPWILHVLLGKVDDETKQQWALHSVEKDMPNTDDFLNFLHRRYDALESCNLNIKTAKHSPKQHIHIATTKFECICCKKPHLLHKCYKFQRYDIDFRKGFISRNNLCSNCLKVGHNVTSCMSNNTCYKCKSKHHTLLHEDQNSEAVKLNVSKNNDSSRPERINQAEKTGLNSYTTTRVKSENKLPILPTVSMATTDVQGNTYYIRALLDTGSESTFITENLAKQLGLKRKHACLSVNGLASIGAVKTKGLINIKLSSRYDQSLFVVANALILDKLSNFLPSQPILLDQDDVKRVNEFCLADPKFYDSSAIEMILGIDVFYEVVKVKRITLKPNLHLLDSLFGWIVAGCINEVTNVTRQCYTIQTSNEDVCQVLRRFWEIETDSFPTLPVDEDSEKHFLSTHRYINGRYMVELPFRENVDQIGSSLREATSRMFAMERKFKKDANLKAEYTRFMQEYQKLQHMSLISEKELNENNYMYYLPHHAVIKQSDTTKKLRVVFDGSCKSSTGLSLNDVLKTGPTIQNDLFTIITRFRKHKIALVSDIEKMYRQVVVHPKHQHFQKILWRENPEDKMQHFKLNTVTYGLTCSAYLAIRSLQQAAVDDNKISPKVSDAIKSDFYVDDLLTGCDSNEEAVKLYNDLTTTLSRAGFNLRQWSSNSIDVLNNIPKQKHGRDSILFTDPETFIKTLGISWLTHEDAFTFNVPELCSQPLTKRRLLSECGRIFDPLGWLAPVTISFKIMLQSLWLTKIEWDDPITETMERAWYSARNEFSCFTNIRIPRSLQMYQNHIVQYHGFCDASEKAYSAVVYSRSTNVKGDHIIRLIAAKTKVAPLKQLSIPRLELCGAVMLSKLMHKIAHIFEASPDTLYAWTDSNIVLSWLADVPRKWNCFVANRTSTIIDKLPSNRWHHVPTKLNPADCASRGLTPRELLTQEIWWNGPSYLQQPTNQWPNYKSTPVKKTTAERRKTILVATNEVSTTNLTNPIEYVANKFSSYMSILRVLGNCLRFADICRKRKVPYLTSEYMQRSENLVIKWAQQVSFNVEILQLQSNNPIKRSNKLRSLNPFIDKTGVLRVGGRLQNSEVGYSAKHPVILSKQHELTDKLVRYLHTIHLHPNPSTLLFITRTKYWIIGAKDIIKKISNSCINCIRTRPRLGEQIMGNLPKPRVTLTRPFTNIGVDYAGPIFMSSKKGRGSKRIKVYISLFVCMATKALHIEVVSDLSTDAFIAALKRFTGRRGLPNAIYSDNATNFVGARRRFNEFYALLSSKNHNEAVTNYLNTHKIEWHTIPPSAPHFGGLWEAGVKSVKTHLRRVLGESAPTLEELQTLLIQIEAICNSRPLTELNDDPEDINVLTPAHFLIGSSLLEVPDKIEDNYTVKLTGRWEFLQNMARGFWKRWHTEYLTMLQKRSKWQHQNSNFKPGDLVLIKEDNSPALSWARGRVTKIHPGDDGKVRVVTLKTGTGELKRPVTKLCKLNIQ